MKAVTRRRVVVDNSALAREIGQRLRAARLRAGLTQQQLAEGRYTKAYVSALEKGLAKPSMAALTFFSDRLGLSPTQLLAPDATAWQRLEADVAVAAGRWADAVEGYQALLPLAASRAARAEILRGLAEASARLDRGDEAIAAAAEAVQLFRALDRTADAAVAEYWLSYGHYLHGNREEALALLRSILERVRGGLEVDADFQVRVLMALASNHSSDGEYEPALAYLEEARAGAEDLDDRRRATFLFSLATSYRATGDVEAALRVGLQALALFRAAGAALEVASLENELALAYLRLGNTARADDLAQAARKHFEELGDRRLLAHVADTQAMIAVATGSAERAAELANEALGLAQEADDRQAQLDALMTLAAADVRLGRPDEALARYERAATLARERKAPAQVRRVLREWSDLLADRGDHQRAYELSREALGISSPR